MSELERMDRIVDDLLLLTTAGQPDFLRTEAVDLNELTAEIHAKASAIAPRDWRLEQTGHGRFLMDPHLVTQAMLQLAANAVTHAPEGPIVVGSSAGDDGVTLWMRDAGPGIAASVQERIFERFARGGGPHRGDGTGLGLPIVKAIADAHGGTVAVESRPGACATFTLVLPLPRAAAGDEHTNVRPQRSAQS